jgi:AcrR family transcriptional regulator
VAAPGTSRRPRSGEGPPPADARRQAIVEAASRSIARHGIAGLRVQQVAAEAGVSVALLYYHYGDRNGLVKAAFEYASEQAPSTALRVAADSGSGYQTLETALLSELDDSPVVRDAAIVWGEVSARAAVDPDFRPIVAAITQAWAATVAEVIERGMGDGSIRDVGDPSALAQRVITLVDGLCVRWLAGALTLSEARELLRSALRDNLLPRELPS